MLRDLVIYGGAGLGIVIAWLVVYFLKHFSVFDVKALGSIVAIVAGGTITAFLGATGSSSKSAAWVGYCLGLFLGVLCFGVLGFGRHYMSGNSEQESRLMLKLPEPAEDPRLKLKLPEPAEDPRLKLIDELHSRYQASKLTISEFSEAKRKLLNSIQEKPPQR